MLAAPALQVGPTNRSIDYTYDGLYRLKSADYRENAALTRAYTYNYDLAGNRTKVTEYVPGVGDYVTNYLYNPANQLTTSKKAGDAERAYSYDDNGNLLGVTADGETFASYMYDAADRLTSFTDASTGDVSTYAYNGMGDRYQQTVDGVTSNYLLDLNSSLTQMIGETQPGSSNYYLLGLDVIGQQGGANWSYFGYDGPGSVRQVTNSTGVVGYSANYDPYGNPLEQFGTLTTNLGFTGEYTDPSGLLYLRARYANLSTGTFISRDPFEGYMMRAMSRNGYSYVEGNPVNYTDPSGKFIVEAIAIAVVVVVWAILASQAANNHTTMNLPDAQDLQDFLEQCVSNIRQRAEDLADGLGHRGIERFDEPITPLTSPLLPITVPPFDSPISNPVPGTGPWIDPIYDEPFDPIFYTKATDRPVIKPGSQDWNNAAKDIASPGTSKDYRVGTLEEARRLLQMGRGNVPEYPQYTDEKYLFGYEVHPDESRTQNAPQNNLPHIKWVDWRDGKRTSGGASGHIYFED